MIVKRNSIHYRLYDTYSKGCVWDLSHGQVNFCKYSRNVMVGVLSVIGIIIAGVLLLIGPMQIAGTSLLWLFTDNGWMPFIGGLWPAGTVADPTWLDGTGKLAWVLLSFETIVVACLIVIGGACYAADKYNESDFEFVWIESDSEPGFIRTWYRSWKDKYCPMIEVEDESE